MSQQPKLDTITYSTLLNRTSHDTYPYISPLSTDLSGKSVLITGASKGIGKAIAISYAKAGCSQIAIAARSNISSADIAKAAADANRPLPQILTIKCDISNESDCANAADQISTQFGHLDILINNAGYLGGWAKLADTAFDDWWRNFEVNLKGTYLMCRAFIPLLLKGGDKTIVNVSSIGGILVMPGASAYQTAKFALLRLTDFLNAEYNQDGLLAYCIHPGGVKTDIAIGMPEFMHVGLTDTPELAGDSVVWLTKEKRSWLASRFIDVKWNMEELEEKREEIESKNLLRMRFRE